MIYIPLKKSATRRQKQSHQSIDQFVVVPHDPSSIRPHAFFPTTTSASLTAPSRRRRHTEPNRTTAGARVRVSTARTNRRHDGTLGNNTSPLFFNESLPVKPIFYLK
jgi:hypothetical protein